MKIRVAGNVKTTKILSMQVTDEHVHDSKALPDLVNGVMKSDKKIVIGKLIADGAYDAMIFLNIYQTTESYHVLK
ncbi:MAG TPA: transposase [Candidatus Nitrosocosmicus sp.]